MISKLVAMDVRMRQASGIGTYIRGISERSQETLPSDLRLIELTSDTPIYSISEQWSIPSAFRKSGADLLHSPHYNVCATLLNRTIVTVHDLIHLKYPEFLPSRAAWLYSKLFLEQMVPRTRGILTVSEHSKADIVSMLSVEPDKVTVTPLAVSPHFVPVEESAIQKVRNQYALKSPYLLYVGNIKEFKNVPRLIQVYQSLKKSDSDFPELVIVGKNLMNGFETVLNSGFGVRWIPQVERADLPALYSGALGFAFPSLYEGFGLPPLEAMACGTPVLCSNRASLPEVVGDAALMIDPEDEMALRRGLVSLAQDRSLRESLRQKGLARVKHFNWERTARATWDAYKRCLS